MKSTIENIVKNLKKNKNIKKSSNKFLSVLAVAAIAEQANAKGEFNSEVYIINLEKILQDAGIEYKDVENFEIEISTINDNNDEVTNSVINFIDGLGITNFDPEGLRESLGLTDTNGKLVDMGNGLYQFVPNDHEGCQSVSIVVTGKTLNKPIATNILFDGSATINVNDSVIKTAILGEEKDGCIIAAPEATTKIVTPEATTKITSTEIFAKVPDFDFGELNFDFLKDFDLGNVDFDFDTSGFKLGNIGIGVGAIGALLLLTGGSSGGTTTPPAPAINTDEDTPITLDLTDDTLVSATSTDGALIIDATSGSAVFTPSADFNGTATIDYVTTSLDKNGNTVTSNISMDVIVNPINDAPVAGATNAITVAEDTASTEIDVLVNASDVDGDTLTITSATATNGTVQIIDGKLVYTGDTNFNGNDTITYVVSDGALQSTSTVDVTVTAVNDDPTSTTVNTANATEDSAFSLDVSDNFDDVDAGDTLTYSISGADWASIDSATGVITGIPLNANVGANSITVTASDNNGGVDTSQTFNVEVANTNDAPVGVNDATVNTNEDTAFDNIDVLSNDTDEDLGDTATLSVVDDVTLSATNGTVTLNADGTLKYTPDADFNGTDTVTYTVQDTSGVTDTATFDVVVAPVNDAPTANADADIVVAEDTATAPIDVLANDVDIDSSLTISSVSANNGTVSVVDGKLIYTGDQDFVGSDVITYTITDGEYSDSATVNVTVTAVNDAPVASNFIATIDEDTATAIDFLNNSNDVDAGDTLTLKSATATNGTIDLVTGIYTPNADFNGQDIITYTVEDALGVESNSATATITINAVNDAPTTGAVSLITVAEDTASDPIDVLAVANDIDNDNSTLTISSYAATNGSVALVDGKLVYTGSQDFVGNDVITYTLSDGADNSIAATINVDVTAVNDDPTSTTVNTANATEDSAFSLDVSASFSDVDTGDTLTYSITPNDGWATIDSATGVVTGTPVNANVGANSITVTASDNNGGVDTSQTFNVEVANTNDAPVGVNDATVNTNEDTALDNIDVLSNDTDEDLGDTATLSVVDDVTLSALSGTVELNVDGTLKYTPNADYNGTDTITYTVQDTSGATDTASFNVVVAPVNDAPVASNFQVDVMEDTPEVINFLDNVADVDNTTAELTLVSANATNGSVDINTGIYTPTLDYVGSDTITFTVEDTAGLQSNAVVTVNVTEHNDTPLLVNNTITIDEGATLTLTVDNFSATDVENDSLTFTVSDVVGGQFEDTSNAGTAITSFTPADITAGTVVFIDNGDEVAPSFKTSVGDGTTNSTPADASVNYTPVNDAPVAVIDGSITVAEDTEITTINILLNDTDEDNTNAELSLLSATAVSGTATPNADGTITYQANLDYVGSDTITYTVQDPSGSTDSITIGVTVTAENDAPVAQNFTATIDEDTATAIDFLNNSNDVDAGDTLTLKSATATNGTVDLVTGIYTPDANFNGQDTITYTVEDASGVESNSATATITINAVNDAPILANNTITIAEGGTLTLTTDNLSATDIENESLTFTVSDVVGGQFESTTAPGVAITLFTATDIVAGTVVFVDDGNEVAPSFKTSVGDGTDSTTPVDASINYASVNDDPTSTAISNTVATEDSAFSLNVSSNFSDVDAGDTLTYTISGADWASIDTDGQITGTPLNANVGTDSITVTASDNNGGTDTTQTFDVVIANTNDDPTSTTINNTVATEDSVFTLDVSGSFSDVDAGDTLTYTISGADWASIDTDGVITGTPLNGDVGTDSITVTASDNNGGTDTTQTFDVVIANTNDAPTSTTITNSSTAEDALYSFDASLNFTDVDAGDTLTYTATLVGGGDLPSWLNIDATTGVLSGTPLNADVGDVNVTVTASDDATPSLSASEDYTLTITNTNDDPTSTAISNTVATEDSVFTLDVSSSFSDVDTGDTLTYTISGADWASIDTDGVITGTPLNGDVGTDSIIVTASDNNGGTDTTQTFDVVIANTNDAPEMANNAMTIAEGATLAITSANISATDVDVPADTLTFTVSDVLGGQFEDTSNTGTAITSFTEADITAGTVVFIDNGDETAPSFKTSVGDGTDSTTPADASVTMTPVNDAPTANTDTASTDEDNSIVVDLLVNDTDPENNDLTITVATLADPTQGTLTIAGDLKTVTFVPTLDFNGSVNINYTITDGNEGSSSTATITVNSINDNPIAVNDEFTTAIDTAYDINVLDNDSDVDNTNAELSVTNASANNGTVTIDPTTFVLTYTPTTGYLGDDTIQYTVIDGNGGSANAEVAVTVNLSGVATDGPLQQALVFFDTNNNDILDNGEISDITGADGSYTLEGVTTADIAAGGTLVAKSITVDDNITDADGNGVFTTDAISGAVMDNIIMRSTGDSTVISPLTTLLKAGIENDDLLEIFGLEVGKFDIKHYNPFADEHRNEDGTMTIDAINFEKVVTQLYTSVNAIAESISSSSVDATTGFKILDSKDLYKMAVDELIAGVKIEAGTRNINKNIQKEADDLDAESLLLIGTARDAKISEREAKLAEKHTEKDHDFKDGDLLRDIAIKTAEKADIKAKEHKKYELDENDFADIGAYNDALALITGLEKMGNFDASVSNTYLDNLMTAITSINKEIDLLETFDDLLDGNVLSRGTKDLIDQIKHLTGKDREDYRDSNEDPERAGIRMKEHTEILTVDTGELYVHNTSLHFTDPDNDTLTYTAMIRKDGKDWDPRSEMLEHHYGHKDGSNSGHWDASSKLPTWLTIDPLTGMLRGTPDVNDVGVLKIKIVATDPYGESKSDKYTLTISEAENTAPVAKDDYKPGVEDNPIPSIDVIGNDSDINSDTLRVVDDETLTASEGTVSVNLDGTLRYVPDANFNGKVFIKYTVSDGNGGEDVGTLTIDIASRNDNPTSEVINPANAIEDSAFTLDVSGSFSDVDNDTLTYSISGADWASIHSTTGVITGTPENDNVGTNLLTVTASDGWTDGWASSTPTSRTFNVEVANTNDAPTGSVTITGTAQSGEELTADNNLADIDGMIGSTINYQWSANGVDITGATSSTYVLSDAEVDKTIKVRASYIDDGSTYEQEYSAATIVVIAKPTVNTPPVAVDDLATINEDSQGNVIDAIANDTDAQGGISIKSATSEQGTATVENGKISFTPSANFNGNATITYVITDGEFEDAGTVNVTVDQVNDPVTGSVIVVGTPTSGEILTATHTLADVDGMGTVSYSWSAGGAVISGATTSTYTLTDAEIGKTITVEASFTDGDNNPEAKSSAETTVVEAKPEEPTADPVFMFTAEVITHAESSIERFGGDLTGGSTETIIKLTLNVDMARVTDTSITSLMGSSFELIMDWSQFEDITTGVGIIPGLTAGKSMSTELMSKVGESGLFTVSEVSSGFNVLSLSTNFTTTDPSYSSLVDNIDLSFVPAIDAPYSMDIGVIYLNPIDTETSISLSYSGDYSPNRGEMDNIDQLTTTIDIL